MADIADILKSVEGLGEEATQSLTEGMTNMLTEVQAKAEADIAALRSSKDEEVTTISRELDLLRANDKRPATELGRSRQELERKYAVEDAEKAKSDAVNNALKSRDELWTARINAEQKGVPESALAECESARDIRMVTATFVALKPTNETSTDLPLGAGSRNQTTDTTGQDALDRMSGWMSQNLGPMGAPGS